MFLHSVLLLTASLLVSCIDWMVDDYEDDILMVGNETSALRDIPYTKKLWPRINGEPTIFYAVHESLESKIQLLRGMMDLIEDNTCIKFTPIHPESPQHKVIFMQGAGCMSYIGYTTTMNKNYQEVYLAAGCLVKGKAIHEMLHAVGLEHTHQRLDRDQYIEVRYNNIKETKTTQFTKTWSSDMPYDYFSIMHYGSTFFSADGKVTIVTKDPFKQNVIGTTFAPRLSDYKMVNKMYQCENQLGSTCTTKTCLNEGFMNDKCVCVCPPHFEGPKCELHVETGSLGEPICGGNVTSPAEITSPGWPTLSVESNCFWYIRAPPCHVIKLTVLGRGFHSAKLCSYNMLEIRNNSLLNGTVFCSEEQLPVNTEIYSSGQEMALYFVSRLKNFADMGFRVKVEFVMKTCEDRPKCSFKVVSADQYIYSTPNFPASYTKDIKCHMKTESEMVFYRIDIITKFAVGEALYLKDNYQNLIYTENVDTSIHVVQPLEFWFVSQAGNNIGGGFQLIITKFNAPHPCSTLIGMQIGDKKTFTNPILKETYPNGGICRLMFHAPTPYVLKALVLKLSIDSLGGYYLDILHPELNTTYEYKRGILPLNSHILEVVFVQNSRTNFAQWNVEVEAVRSQ